MTDFERVDFDTVMFNPNRGPPGAAFSGRDRHPRVHGGRAPLTELLGALDGARRDAGGFLRGGDECLGAPGARVEETSCGARAPEPSLSKLRKREPSRSVKRKTLSGCARSSAASTANSPPDELVEDARERKSLEQLCEACYYPSEVCPPPSRVVEARSWFEKSVQTDVVFDPNTTIATPMNEHEPAQWRLETRPPPRFLHIGDAGAPTPPNVPTRRPRSSCGGYRIHRLWDAPSLLPHKRKR